MPKKKKSTLFSNTSELKVCPLSHDEVWDDTELIEEYESALLEWRQSCQGTGFVGSSEKETFTDTVQEAPEIGPWVTVETHAFDPENYTMNPVIGLDDDEFLNMFDLALTDWKEERGLTLTVADTNKKDQTDMLTSNFVTSECSEEVQPASIPQ